VVVFSIYRKFNRTMEKFGHLSHIPVLIQGKTQTMTGARNKYQLLSGTAGIVIDLAHITGDIIIRIAVEKENRNLTVSDRLHSCEFL
jgi:uncharacterized membrane protein